MENELPDVPWTKLSLRLLPQLEAEVEEVSAMYIQAQSQGEEALAEFLYRQISLRLDEMEGFYLENDGDERAVLVEKQRLRLKKALQFKPPPPPPPPPEDTDPPPPPPPVTAAADFLPLPPPLPSAEEAVDGEEGFATPLPRRRTGSVSSSAKRKNLKAIYAWERRNRSESEASGNDRSVATRESGSNAASDKLVDQNAESAKIAGVNGRSPLAAAEEAAARASAAASAGKDAVLLPLGGGREDAMDQYSAPRTAPVGPNVLASFQVRVSEKDYHAIMARQRVARSARRHKELQRSAQKKGASGSGKKSGKGGASLLSQGPYVERNLSLRKEDRSKWLGKEGFRA